MKRTCELLCAFLIQLCESSSSLQEKVKRRFIKGLERWVHSGFFHDDMIRVARSILADHILYHRGKNLYGHLLNDEDVRRVLNGEADSFGPIINHGLLGNALGIQISIISLPTDENPLQIHSNDYFKNSVAIRLLNITGHYGLLYP